MAFVADGTEWSFDGWSSQEICAAIDLVLARVAVAKERQETVWIGDDFQTRPVLGTLDLWSMLSPDAPIEIPPEIGQELAAWLGTAPNYVDEQWPEGFLENVIAVDNEPALENTDIAWAHHNLRSGRAVACLGIRRLGPHRTTSSKGAVSVHWVNNEMSHRAFWRSAIDVEGDSQDALQRVAPHAFPDLYFADGVWRGINRFDGGYLGVRLELRRYLSALDDEGSWAFTCPPPALSRTEQVAPQLGATPSNQIVERRFRGLNLDMAPEKPDVYRNAVCRNARETKIANRTLYCEWHAKLEPHRNRIYVHPPIPESDGKVVIAFFHEHLPLPG